jgi:hypothetical protein
MTYERRFRDFQASTDVMYFFKSSCVAQFSAIHKENLTLRKILKSGWEDRLRNEPGVGCLRLTEPSFESSKIVKDGLHFASRAYDEALEEMRESLEINLQVNEGAIEEEYDEGFEPESGYLLPQRSSEQISAKNDIDHYSKWDSKAAFIDALPACYPMFAANHLALTAINSDKPKKKTSEARWLQFYCPCGEACDRWRSDVKVRCGSEDSCTQRNHQPFSFGTFDGLVKHLDHSRGPYHRAAHAYLGCIYGTACLVGPGDQYYGLKDVDLSYRLAHGDDRSERVTRGNTPAQEVASLNQVPSATRSLRLGASERLCGAEAAVEKDDDDDDDCDEMPLSALATKDRSPPVTRKRPLPVTETEDHN